MPFSYSATNAFVGGNAGAGNPPGVPRTGGKDTHSGVSFGPGEPGTVCGAGLSVLLDYDLNVSGVTLFAKGTKVSLTNITGGHISGPEAGCNDDHYHGAIDINGNGFTDPNPTGCGFGKVVPDQ